MLSRRAFLRDGACALVSLGFAPSFLTRTVAAAPRTRGAQLIAIFQRGAVDGLSMVVPYAEADYYRTRPSIALAVTVLPGETRPKRSSRSLKYLLSLRVTARSR